MMAFLIRAARVLLLFAALVVALGPRPPKVRPKNLPTYKPATAGILNGTDFAGWVTSQARQGRRAVALAPGQYTMRKQNAEDDAYIVFQHLRDITVWMDRVNISMTDNTVSAFRVESCHKLTTYGPTVWWQVPGFGQATITAVTPRLDDDAYDIQFHLDDGYDPTLLFADGGGGYYLEGDYTLPATGRLQAGPGWSSFSGTVTAVEGAAANTYAYTYTEAYFAPQVGAKILSRGHFLFCNQVVRSNDTAFHDFTMLNCGGFGFFLSLNRRIALHSLTLKPASFPPPGGTELPARCSSADGIHSSNDYVGPTIDSAYFAALDDDCIAIHGSLANTSNARGQSFDGTINAQPGDVLRFYTPRTFVPLGTAVVRRSSSTDPNAPATLTVGKLPKGFRAGNTQYVNQNRVGSGFAIRNTHTAGNRGRGAIIKASNGVIENNVFEGVTYGALFLGPEFAAWGEADYVHNLTIRNNSIIECSYLNKAGSAFDIHGDSGAEGSGDPTRNPSAGNYNITVAGLTIARTGSHSNLYVGAAHDVRMSDVVIEDALAPDYTLWETTPDAVVNFQNVAFSGSVGICMKNYHDREGVEKMKQFGNVTGAPSSLGDCEY